jgi:hypothetical protein
MIGQSWPPLTELLHELLDRITADLPGALGAAISVRDDDGLLTALATDGIGQYFAPAQIEKFGGPVPHAACTQQPIFTENVFADERWPCLTFEALRGYAPALRAQWDRVRGAAALPAGWEDSGMLVLSATLDRPATSATVDVLGRCNPGRRSRRPRAS